MYVPGGKATSLKQCEDPYTSSESATAHRLCDSVALLDRARNAAQTYYLAMVHAREVLLYYILLETYLTNIGQSTLLTVRSAASQYSLTRYVCPMREVLVK